MSNIFQEVLTDATSVEQNLLGPSYPYWQNINAPSSIGMSSDGTLSQLGTNIGGIIDYVEVLVSGQGAASSTGQPLGNKFFLQTGAQCNDVSTGQEVDRYIYINNVPSGNIPFISSGMGTDFSDFRGLIPGTMGNLNVLNPYTIMQSFMSGSTPNCQELTMQTIDVNNTQGTQTQFVTTVDIQNMDPCTFQNGTNPITNQKCSESYQNLSPQKIPKDPIIQLYFALLGLFLIYILYCIMIRRHRK